jgi:hypothetical protein
VKTERKVLSLVAVCLLLWSAGGLGPVAGMASQPPAGGEPLAPDEPAASDVWVSPSALNLAVWEGGTATIALTIGNSGADPLEWVLSVATGGTNVVGDWIVYYDWGCVGAPGSGAFTFYSDHTFTYYIYTGTWTQTDNQVTWTFPNGTQYSGHIAGNKMAGTMNVPGCWEADRILTATVTVRSGERTASGEPAEAPGVEAEWAVPDAQPVERVRPGEGPEPPAGREGVPEIDLTTCRPAAAAPHQDLSPLLDVEAGGSVLWDLTHGVYYDYEPAGLYSSLVSLLNSAGYTVDTTAAGVNNVDLWAYDVLVVNVASAWDNAYTPAELEVIEYYVWNGGSLLVLADNLGVPNQHVEPVCRAFGALCGFGALPSPITRFVRHPITAAVGAIEPAAGGAILASPPVHTVALGPGDQDAVAAGRAGWGRVVVIGDANVMDNTEIGYADNQLFSENVFHWLPASWLSATPSSGSVPAGDSRAVTVRVEDAWPNPPGEYGLLTIHTNDPDEALLSVPVSVAPQAAPDLVAVPFELGFALADGDMVFKAWSTYNLGSQALDWRLSTSTGGTHVPGDWVVYYDWGCNGWPGSAVNAFNADHTFTTSEEEWGTWQHVNNRMVWTFSSGSQYTGFIAGDVMAGTMHGANGDPGCWEAERVRAAVVTVRSGEQTAAGEPAGAPGAEFEYVVPDARSVEPMRPAPASGDGETDLATGGPVAAAPHQILSPLQADAAGGRVLWDLTHALYFYGEEPFSSYSSLLDLLASSGYVVEWTVAGVDSLDLSRYDVLVVDVRSSYYSAYTPAEVAAIENFVFWGGGLLIMCDEVASSNANVNPVAGAFGTTCGLSNTDALVTNLASHAIFASVGQISPQRAGELSAVPPSQLLAWDPGGKGVVTVAGVGGRVVVVGDSGLWNNTGLGQPDNQLFAENTFHWLASWLSARPALGTTPGGFSSEDIWLSVATSRNSPGEAGLVTMYSNDPDTRLLMLPVEMQATYFTYLPVVLKW